MIVSLAQSLISSIYHELHHARKMSDVKTDIAHLSVSLSRARSVCIGYCVGVVCDGIAGIFKCTRENEAFYLKTRKVRVICVCARARACVARVLTFLNIVYITRAHDGVCVLMLLPVSQARTDSFPPVSPVSCAQKKAVAREILHP